MKNTLENMYNTGSKRLSTKASKKLAKASRDFRKSGKRNLYVIPEENNNTHSYS